MNKPIGSASIEALPRVVLNPKLIFPHLQKPAICPYPEPDQ
jgi:hypothetical protein